MVDTVDPDILPLLLASPRVAREDESQVIDRLRMQKAVFLMRERGPRAWRDAYDFEPYDWGPYSSGLSARVADLIERGLLVTERVGVRGYGSYRTTAAGERLLDNLAVPKTALDFTASVRHFVTSRSFSKLLKDVYAAYPQYAANSRFRA